MPAFLVCIELLDATGADYASMSASLESLGFGRNVRADDGRVHELPTGKYIGTGEGTPAQVKDLVTQVVAETGKGFRIFVVQCQGAASWIGLPVVQNVPPIPAPLSPADETVKTTGTRKGKG
jgi:hypothetical protein